MGQKDITGMILLDYNEIFSDIINVLMFNGENEVAPETLENAALAYVGEEKSNNAYPVKSIMDAGGVVDNHSDYPVSPVFSGIQAFCNGVLKKLPSDPDDYIRNIDQAISRHEALKTLTSNVAYMWHEEDRMGTISIGKLANFVVLDKDLMHDDMSEIEKASCLATIVDGEIVYQANL